MAEMLTAKDMQNLLQVDRSTIYRMAEAGRLPAVKVGKQWRFPGNEVQSWLNQTEPAAVVSPPVGTKAKPGSLADLLPVDCVQLIQDTFADLLGLMVLVTDMEGNPITEISHPCGLFAAIQDVPDAVRKCMDSWRTLAMRVELEPKFLPSHLGLLCARGLIRVGTELKGMAVIAGVAPKDWPPAREQVESMATEFGVEPELLFNHLSEVFYLDEVQQAAALPFVQKIADIIAHIAAERSRMLG